MRFKTWTPRGTKNLVIPPRNDYGRNMRSSFGKTNKYVNAANLVLGSYGKLRSGATTGPYVRNAEKKMANAVMNLLRMNKGESSGINPSGSVLALPGTTPYQKIANIGTGLTRTNYTFGKPIRNSWTRDGQKYTQAVTNVGVALATAQGYNGIQDLSGIGVSGEIAAYSQKMFAGSGVTSNNSSTSYLSMGGYDTEMFLAHMKRTVYITSSTSVNCTLRIYECVAKLDSSDIDVITPFTAWRTGLFQQMGDAYVTGALTGTVYQIGMFPSAVRCFRTFWHIDKYFDIQLPAGSSHIHTSEYNVNATIPFQRAANTNIMGGISRFNLYVLSGTPVHAVGDTTVVGMGSTSVDIVENKITTWYGKTNTQSVRYTTYNVPSFLNGQGQVGDTDIQERLVVV